MGTVLKTQNFYAVFTFVTRGLKSYQKSNLNNGAKFSHSICL
jgi:hypothetical protein